MRKDIVSRRQLLVMTGAAGATAFAGCFGGDDDDENPDEILSESDFDDVVDDIDYNEAYEDEFHHVTGAGNNPFDDEFVYNPYHPNYDAGVSGQGGACEYLAVYHSGDDEFVPRTAEDWEIDDENRTVVSFSDDYGWSDGTPITAHDFVTQFKLDAYMEVGTEEFIDPADGIYAEDEYTLVLEPRDEYTDLEEALWMNQWALIPLQVSEKQYGEFVERFEDAEDDDERTDIQQELLDLTVSWNEALLSGPFVYVEANEEYADQVPNPEHPIAQDWEFFQRYGIYEEEEGLRAEELDWLINEPGLEDLPDIYDEAPPIPSAHSFVVLFGPQDEYIQEYPGVRQALAYAIDTPSLVEVAEPHTEVDEYSAGISAWYLESYVDDDVLDAMTNYAPHDTDRATELLEDIGFELEDDQWYTPDGDEWTVNFSAGDWFDVHSDLVANDLAEFGIDMDHYVTEMPTWQSETEQGNDFDMAFHMNYGVADEWHPYSDLNEEFYNPTRGLFEGRDIIDPEVEVPEVGNPDGEMVTMNLEEELEAMAVADEDGLQEHATNLAWAHNYLLPAVTVAPGAGHAWVNTGEWDFDIESDDWLTTNDFAHYLVQNGLSPE